MDEREIDAKVERANKLIFVKQYEKANDVLESIVSDSEGRLKLLVHLRRIELAARLGRIDNLRDEYIKALAKSPDAEAMTWETCLAFVEQHGEMISDSEAVTRYQALMRKYGTHPAFCYGLAFSMECQGNQERAIYNYEQALHLDSKWYPAYFGLSQIYYDKNEDGRADQYFFLFEKSAPYNLYGNFETHKNLGQEFLEAGDYSGAEAAVRALSEWWTENKGVCPAEIQVFEALSLSRIREIRGDYAASQEYRANALEVAARVLKRPDSGSSVLYFIAKLLEEYGEHEMAFDYYRSILRREGTDPQMVEKIGGQFLSLGEHEIARDLFQEAYEANPNNAEIRFCRLVSDLRFQGINVEDYLIGRERLAKLIEARGDRVELLALLHSLLAKYTDDADIHAHMADVYLRLGNTTRAQKHFDRMYELDSRSQATSIKYAGFLMQHGDPELAVSILKPLEVDEAGDPDTAAEIRWLMASYHFRTDDYHKCLDMVRAVLRMDPWNVSYLVQEIQCLTRLAGSEHLDRALDRSLMHLISGDESLVDWSQFAVGTEALRSGHHYELCYARSKLEFLYSKIDIHAVLKVVASAQESDLEKGTFDFLRLLNTNFDGPEIYVGLGTLSKEQWQLETAAMWFDQALNHPTVTDEARTEAYLQAADCLIWQNLNLAKAVEYAKLAIDLDSRHSERAATVLAHAYLREGKVQEARTYLEQQAHTPDGESTYLKGLYHYRNGHERQANEIWKPLLTLPSKNLKTHNIKQEVLRYYFDKDPYLLKAS